MLLYIKVGAYVDVNVVLEVIGNNSLLVRDPIPIITDRDQFYKSE